MRILVATPYLPWPSSSGGNAAQFATLRSLQADHEFVVVTLLQTSRQQADLAELRQALPGIRFIGVEVRPERDRPSVVKAARHIYRAAKGVISPQAPRPQVPHYPFHSLTANFLETLSEELRRGVDLFQAEFAEMLPLGTWLPAGLPRIFVHHQIHFVYAQRFIETVGGAVEYAKFLGAAMRCQEIAFLDHFNAVITFSDHDREILRSVLSGVDVVTSPFPVPADIEVIQGAPAPFNGTFSFVGSEAHFPNQDALAWLLRKVWPKILGTIPSARLNIAGDWSEKAKKALAAPNVNFTGFVANLSSVMKGSVVLAPLRIGSGIRVKILAALALGAPVVTTRIGCEGLMCADGENVLIRDSADDFAAAAIELTRRPALWRSLSSAGRETVLKHYSPESVRIQRNQIYNRIASKRSVAAPANELASVLR